MASNIPAGALRQQGPESAGGNYPLHRSRKMMEVKNKMPAPVQITAEQLLREAVDRQLDDLSQIRPQQRIVDEEELQQYRVRKRKEFEDTLRRQRHHIGTWIKYAEWEAAQKEFRRARSVFERALNVDFQNTTLWLKYIEMESKNKFINSCRNLYDRVCLLLPRQEQFWFKYAHMEELLGNYAGARNVFERWMEWNPSDKGWMLYIHFEERCKELDRARKVFERYLSNRPSQESFLRFCKFEERHRQIPRARAGFEKAIELLPEDMLDEHFFLKFAQFEERQRETERAKVIYQQALEQLPKGESDLLYEKYVTFQKQFGDKEGIEDTVLSKRVFVYEEELHGHPLNYDCWIDYIRLEESRGDIDKIRNVYERALANVPPVLEKRFWKRYVYIWISYALFEELQAKDVERCRQVYVKMLEVIPHKKFSFAKIWSLYASFEVRQRDLDKARLIFGRAIAECGKPKIFVAYAQLELRLGCIDRCRKIYAKFIELHPFNPRAWIAMIDLEVLAEEQARARALCELAIGMEEMDTPELLWKAYIDMEVGWGAVDRARSLYERLLEKTQHVKVFKSFADFEWRIVESLPNARKVIERGIEVCKENSWDEERASLLEHWLSMERESGDAQSIGRVFNMLPKKVKKIRVERDKESGAESTVETTAYVFPDDPGSAANLKILQAAKLWKRKQAAAG
ncbi:crooked neck family 1 protein isoform 2, putative [Toxoplasma gondii ME49]|uniref:Crooked neck family 1 protein isoform 2, putative n=2 Tax=Toxoplasma gondii TaxID=5811 RepID=S8EY47_TOXGM|nr:crooked neck family 1 protein isoform 2, putative [Toxoplasma gondii ME49]EPT28311.1 crooked neck family 1 protein isoform 2, putative [Toxoplasma gondii ME49]|eukprot:XP_018636570.1 crooked neck family 1 protein isoform 2, putative [Toxoplasma gondii ME49]